MIITNIKPLCVQHLNCHFNNGIILFSPRSFVQIKFKQVLEQQVITLRVKRISGNGKLIVNNQPFLVSSKLGELLQIVSNQTLEISKPPDAIGEILIFQIEMPDVLEHTLSVKWKNIVANCEKYSCISQQGDRLFASAGGFLESSNIISCKTNPENVGKRKNHRITFPIACEITELEMVKVTTTNSQINIFPPHDVPVVINQDSTRVAPDYSGFSYLPLSPPLTKAFNMMVYDSDFPNEMNSLKASNKNCRFLPSNGKIYIVLNTGANLILNASFSANTDYVIVITGKKIGGNGRLIIRCLLNGEIVRESQIIAENKMDDLIVAINSNSQLGERRIQLLMDATGSGEILIGRVQVMSGLTRNVKNVIEKVNTKNISEYNFQAYSSDHRNYMKKFSAPSADLYDGEITFPEISGVIEPVSYSSKMWMKKVCNLLPNIKVRGLVPLRNSNSTKESAQLVMGALGCLKQANRIWVEEFQGDPSSEDIDLLNLCKVVLTPSLENSIKLKNALSDVEIKIVPKLWPRLGRPVTTQDYVIYFEKNKNHTSYLLNKWKEEYPLLFVVGSNLPLPKNAKHISEYLPYSETYRLISGAKMVIDLGSNIHYSSGLIELCLDLGKPILTNNHKYITNDLVSLVKNENDKVEILNLSEVLKNSLSKITQSISGRDEKLKQNIIDLLGVQI